MASTVSLAALTTNASPTVITTGKAFAGNYYKLAPPNFSARDVKIVQLISLVHSVFSAIDYRSALSTTLVSDAEIYMRGISNIDLNVAQAVTHWALAFQTDATITNDVVAILKEGQKLNQMSEQELDRIIAYLCTIGPV